MNLGSLPFRLCVYFATAPDEELSSADIALKFSDDIESMNQRLKPAVDAGYLSSKPGGKANSPRIYSAGPLLLRMLGRPVK